MSQFTQNNLSEILKAKPGPNVPGDFVDWKSRYHVADQETKNGIAELVAGKLIKGQPMSNSYPNLKRRFNEHTETIVDLRRNILAPFADQPECLSLVAKLIDDMDVLSHVMPFKQSNQLFKKLKELNTEHQKRLLPYTGLCVQRSIAETYEEETRSTLVNNLEKEISQLEEQEDFYKKQVNGGAPTDDAKKNALTELRKTRIQLESKRTELIEKKGVDTVFDPSDANNFATQQYGNDEEEDDEEETDQQKLLSLKQKLREEYESRGSKKRKASSNEPDGATATAPKKRKSFLGWLWGESEEA